MSCLVEPELDWCWTSFLHMRGRRGVLERLSPLSCLIYFLHVGGEMGNKERRPPCTCLLIFYFDRKNKYINKNKEEDRCLKAPYRRLCTPHIQAVEHKKQLKRGAKLSALSKIKSLKNQIFQALKRGFYPLKSSSITLPPYTPKNNMR